MLCCVGRPQVLSIGMINIAKLENAVSHAVKQRRDKRNL